ncbi:DUF1292 domain-containing protein [Cellulosilyticum sp. ST5]|uniref:DUF1292 domain-containing protein n=1 Tax=Cellulosilyticum lentocellum (strain ATCC 49066 / DSM 5427 / NCIMB 11756 / RHM5) TaxID=642492 RepID=F2JQZ7_CELLD|nr:MULTISPECIES: DUF1292 domain-containing protein [Cellulosilyticum]ADZ83855.1 protein of unknown function DUF1292 [Cellulosilyticum lentocellum DSM 5427]QEH69244.1 DUF1292 domain-containing protein [Cellulosilyticum sp. WCF-2]
MDQKIGENTPMNENNMEEVVEKISFVDEETGEEILFEVIDEVIIDNIKYILVVDEEDISTILKQINEKNEELEYALVEDEDEFKKAAVEFMTNEEYDIEL